MNTKKKVIIGILIVLIIGLAIGGIYMFRTINYKKQVENIKVQGIDLSTISDGSYQGSCDVDYISAKVNVTVKDNKITNIDLDHFNDRGAAADAIPNMIIEQQRVDVDTVSGATNSSKVIMQAVYNALSKQ